MGVVCVVVLSQHSYQIQNRFCEKHSYLRVDWVWNMMAHAQKPDFVFQRNRRVHLNRRVRQLSRLLAAEVCASAVIMLDTPCSEVVWRVLANQSIRQFPLHFPSRASPCAITLQLDSTTVGRKWEDSRSFITDVTGRTFRGFSIVRNIWALAVAIYATCLFAN